MQTTPNLLSSLNPRSPSGSFVPVYFHKFLMDIISFMYIHRRKKTYNDGLVTNITVYYSTLSKTDCCTVPGVFPDFLQCRSRIACLVATDLTYLLSFAEKTRQSYHYCCSFDNFRSKKTLKFASQVSTLLPHTVKPIERQNLIFLKPFKIA